MLKSLLQKLRQECYADREGQVLERELSATENNDSADDDDDPDADTCNQSEHDNPDEDDLIRKADLTRANKLQFKLFARRSEIELRKQYKVSNAKKTAF